MDPRTDAELLAAATGDAEALGAFYDRHETAVLAYFARRTRDPEAAAELTAETFAAVVAQLRRRRVAVRDPGGWLWAIARSRLADYHRRGAVDDRLRRRVGMERLAWDDEALERVDALAGDPALVAALEALPGEERDAVVARHVQERGYAEIAAAQGIAETAARKRVSRALARLRRRLGETPAAEVARRPRGGGRP
jgi:RNA polymerase sigma factor (sigma-70 family)